MPKVGEERYIPLWILDREVVVRFRWNGKGWESVEEISFPPRSITISISDGPAEQVISGAEEEREE